MKVVHLSTYDTGGAAVSARRLHSGLINEGVDSSFLSLFASGAISLPNKEKFSVEPLPLYKKVMKKAGFAATRKDRNIKLLKGRNCKYELYTFPLTDHFVEHHHLVADADIVQLHWVSDFINYPSFFRSITKPIVWTLHDMNPLLGGFHYMGDRERCSDSFSDLENELVSVKLNALKENRNITVVTPSQWLGENLHLNSVLRNSKYEHIPYGLDLTVFKPFNKDFARSVFNLPTDKRVLLFVSDRIDNHRKGFDLLMDAIGNIESVHDLCLITIGSMDSKVSQRSNNILSLGKITDERIMSLVFSAADAFVLPSREDNLPNVMLESIACGTPVLAFPTGGIKEVIQHGFNGLLASDLSSDALRMTIDEFLKGNSIFSREAIRTFSKRFDLSVQAKRYHQVYKEILSGDHA